MGNDNPRPVGTLAWMKSSSTQKFKSSNEPRWTGQQRRRIQVVPRGELNDHESSMEHEALTNKPSVHSFRWLNNGLYRPKFEPW